MAQGLLAKFAGADRNVETIWDGRLVHLGFRLSDDAAQIMGGEFHVKCCGIMRAASGFQGVANAVVTCIACLTNLRWWTPEP